MFSENEIISDRYQIREQLSKKAGRRTFLALELQSQNLVIIKILLFDPDCQWDDLRLFEREAKTLQNLDNPAIPKYLDYFEIEHNNYQGFALVQTYINAPSLDTIIQDGRQFSELELIEIAEKLLNILIYLHGQNPPVIHRDIKPSNILLTNRSGNSVGDVYLVDFGSVKTSASKEGGTITIVGTDGYIPLEQFGGKAVLASDLYSLGMTIIYLATGLHPSNLTKEKGQIKINILPLSRQLQNWLKRMTKPYIDQRFTSAQTAKNALKSIDGNIVNYPDIKPKYTTIKLHCDGDRMEIILIPPINFWDDIGTILVWYLILSLSAIFFFVLSKEAGWFIVVITYTIISCIFIVGHLINATVERKTIAKISINDQQIKAYNVYGANLNKFPIMANLRSEISLLAYYPSYEFDKFLDRADTRKNTQEAITDTEPKLIISAASHDYLITRVSEAEFLWLGKELSEFLDLKLEIFQPTTGYIP